MDDTLKPVVGGLAALLLMIGIMTLLETGRKADEVHVLRLGDEHELKAVKSEGLNLPQVGKTGGITFQSVDQD